MRYIFTCQETSRELTLYEFKLYDKTFNFTCWLDREVGLAETDLNQMELAALIRSTPIIFVRHIFCVDTEVMPDVYFDSLLGLCLSYHEEISENKISVQVRASDNPCMPEAGLALLTSQKLSEAGILTDVKNGDLIASVYVGDNSVYIGIGTAETNLSKWRGGMPFYSKSSDFNFVSRAEYKLLEAFENFNIELSNYKRALDLGAAPGGWTKALCEHGISVVSVDPNRLDRSLSVNKAIKYYSMTAERYLKLDTSERFDIIVDDMKIDPDKSIALVKNFYDRLGEGGLVVVTLKLAHGFSYKLILDCLANVEPFSLIGARQLFHNRSEITVVLGK